MSIASFDPRATALSICLLAGSLVSLTVCAGEGQDPAGSSMHDVAFRQSGISSARSDWHAKEGMFYKRNWGVDIIGVRVVSSGWMLRFDYRVLDDKKAKPLFDKAAKPYLVDNVTGARLAVPTMENIGDLRQSPVPTVNRNYFMIFGNPGQLVKPGSNVSVVIGNFRADGLMVN